MAQIKVKIGDLVRFYRPDPAVLPSMNCQVIGVVTGESCNFVNVEINGVRYLSNKSCLAHDKWIPWKGGNCPIPDNTPHRIRFRDGWESETVINPRLRWYHDNNDGDIIAYQIRKDYK